MDLTFVTCFYDLNKFELRPSLKTKENYMVWAEFLFQLDMNIVFFVSNEDYPLIFEKRMQYGLLEKTLIIAREFSDLKFYCLRDELAEYKKENPILNSEPNKDSPNYIILTWNKIFFVEEVINLNHFNSTHFGWIDFGLWNVIKYDMPANVIETLKPRTDKIKILQLRNVFNKEVQNLKEYASLFRWKIAGGLWTGGKNVLLDFFKLFKAHLFKMMSLRLFCHEETLFALTYINNKHLFESYYGNYYQILINYEKINNPVELIFENISNSRDNHDHENAFIIACKIYNGCFNILPINKKYFIYDEIIINGYYFGKEITIPYINNFINDLEINQELQILIIQQKTRFLSNIEFFDNPTNMFIKRIEQILSKNLDRNSSSSIGSELSSNSGSEFIPDIGSEFIPDSGSEFIPDTNSESVEN